MRKKLLLAGAVVLLLLIVWVWFGPLGAWRSIDRVAFDPAEARVVLAEMSTVTTLTNGTTSSTVAAVPAETAAQPTTSLVTAPATTLAPSAAATAAPIAAVDTALHDVYLILGSDEKPRDNDIRADAIMLLVIPDDRAASLLVSIPRALYVNSPCTNRPEPININLEGCGAVSGLDLMGVAVEDHTGLAIDHLVLFDFDGFQAIVDRIGGLEVCVDNPIKLKEGQRVFLEPGCSVLDGRQALRWVRSRQTLEQIDGQWQLMDGAGDAARTARQRTLLRQVMGRAEQFDSPGALASIASELSDSFVLDEGFDLNEAIALAWDLRAMASRPMYDVTIEATGAVSPDGDFVLTPDQPFASYLDEYLG